MRCSSDMNGETLRRRNVELLNWEEEETLKR